MKTKTATVEKDPVEVTLDEDSSFDDWEPASDWVEKRGKRLFRTLSAYEWFYRQNTDELVSAGAVMRICNRKHVHKMRIEPAVLQIIRKQQLGN